MKAVRYWCLLMVGALLLLLVVGGNRKECGILICVVLLQAGLMFGIFRKH